MSVYLIVVPLVFIVDVDVVVVAVVVFGVSLATTGSTASRRRNRSTKGCIIALAIRFRIIADPVLGSVLSNFSRPPEVVILSAKGQQLSFFSPHKQ
jgi:hypothetical protein